MEKTEELLQEILDSIKSQEDKLLTAEDISREYNINVQTVRKILREENLPVMTNIKPQRILKSEWLKYCASNHK